MHRTRRNHLRRCRRQSGLTQDEVAYLLCGRTGGSVSRYERSARRPNLEAAFGHQAIFGAAAHELFADVFAEVELAIIQRAILLSQRLSASSSGAAGKRKLRFLSELIERSR